MAEFRLQLGGVVDVASKQELDDAVTGLQGHIDSRFARQGCKFVWRTLTASSFQSFNGGTFQLVLEPQKPAMGKVWSARRLVVTGADDNATVANLKAAFYVGDPFNFTLGQLISPAVAIPSVQFFSTRAVPIKDTEVAFVNFVNSGGAVNFQTIQASLLVEEWNEADINSMRE